MSSLVLQNRCLFLVLSFPPPISPAVASNAMKRSLKRQCSLFEVLMCPPFHWTSVCVIGTAYWRFQLFPCFQIAKKQKRDLKKQERENQKTLFNCRVFSMVFLFVAFLLCFIRHFSPHLFSFSSASSCRGSDGIPLCGSLFTSFLSLFSAVWVDFFACIYLFLVASKQWKAVAHSKSSRLSICLTLPQTRSCSPSS